MPLLSRVMIGSAALSVVVAGMFVVLLVAMSGLRSSTNAQARSKDVSTATLEVERVVNGLEASLRGYLLGGNGNGPFLASWQQARAELPPAIAELEQRVASQPEEKSQALQLDRLIREYITEYGLPFIVIHRVDPEAARSADATGEGLRRINAIRLQLVQLLANENSLASAREVSAKHDAARAVRVGVGALVVTASLLLLFGIFLTRGVVRPVRMVAAGATRVAAGDLSTRLPEQGAAELHELTEAFNAMARSLEQGKRELETQNEQLRHSERLKSELVSIVSHELRTPLASILGYSSLLLRRNFGQEDTQRYIETINTQGRRLASLVEEFLDVERVEAGRIELREEPVDLRPLLQEEAQLISAEAPRHHVEVAVEAGSMVVRGDADRLAQVYANLLANAVKYSPDGGLIEVSGAIVGDVVRVQVKDEGVGIATEHQSRIFTKFFRGEAREGGFAGTGLGLAVSREIIEAHGGRIGFRSAPDTGSAFWFELPLVPKENPLRVA
jgi:signal transduction histidine kinase